MSYDKNSAFGILLLLAGVSACDSDNDTDTTNGGASGNSGTEYGSGGTTNPGGSNLSGAGGSGASQTSSGGTSSSYSSTQGGTAGSLATGGAPAAGAAGIAGNAGNATSVSATLNDAEVIHVLSTLNTGEIQQAQIATSKAQSVTVRNFAQRMITEHATAATTTNTVAATEQLTAENNPISVGLQTQSDAVLSQLNAATPAQFDRVYMTSQVTAHQETLVLIDTGLLPSAERAAVDSLLSNLRTSIATHLVEAQNILAALP